MVSGLEAALRAILVTSTNLNPHPEPGRTMRSISCSALLVLGLLARPGAAGPPVASPPDSMVYHIDPSSRLVVKTGKSGLLSFAGHTHLIRARAVRGELIYRPGTAMSSLRLTVPTDSLEVLTPPDTAEIRKVTDAMRTEVLHVDKYPQMVFAADSLRAASGKMQLQLALTMEGTTRTVPVTAEVTLGEDTVRAGGAFTAKQTDFGIKPFSGGPGVCPGRNLVLLTTSAMLDAMLEHHRFHLRSHELGEELPGTLDHFRLEFDVTPK